MRLLECGRWLLGFEPRAQILPREQQRVVELELDEWSDASTLLLDQRNGVGGDCVNILTACRCHREKTVVDEKGHEALEVRDSYRWDGEFGCELGEGDGLPMAVDSIGNAELDCGLKG
ncbi:trans-resveratrol di-O-methyltransferase-like isoform X2 [Iris pallida]|uniref:Trans-resveratrol di-O-methyltransferase-like isoform X2 n=1 Tax=Iris pallida TaxID=29817 RepID=A0AAX6F9T6_IRIPA|nr:trans-resveratrol di-O-methyltransferase-like isoform X2 [Iris pallida]